MIKVIIFDIDDTLTQTIKIKWQALKETGKRFYSLNIIDDELKKYWGIPFNQLIVKLFGQADPLEKIIDNYYSIIHEFPAQAHKGVVDFLNKLQRKYLLCALTSSSKRLIDKDLSDSKIDKNWFFEIQTQDDTSIHKPDPLVFKPLLLKLEQKYISEKEVIYVGDSLLDYQAATSAGISFYAVTTGLTTKVDFLLKGLEGEKIIPKLSELLPLLSH